jgi:predicted small secreted protein
MVVGLRPVNRPRCGYFLEESVMYLKLLAAMLAITFMAGCNTMSGVGKDVESVGNSLENSAEKHKK